MIRGCFAAGGAGRIRGIDRETIADSLDSLRHNSSLCP